MSGKRVLARVGGYAAAIIVSSTAPLVVAEPAHAACRVVRIWSPDTDQDVAAEKDGQVGTWELSTICSAPTNVFTLRAQANGLLVTREQEYGGAYRYMLRARTAAFGRWDACDYTFRC
jgi:hypothetical protein